LGRWQAHVESLLLSFSFLRIKGKEDAKEKPEIID
jgi:hypothetical protein